MPVNSKITASGAAQLSNPMFGCRVSLDELRFTATLTVGEPRGIIRAQRNRDSADFVFTAVMRNDTGLTRFA